MAEKRNTMQYQITVPQWHHRLLIMHRTSGKITFFWKVSSRLHPFEDGVITCWSKKKLLHVLKSSKVILSKSLQCSINYKIMIYKRPSLETLYVLPEICYLEAMIQWLLSTNEASQSNVLNTQILLNAFQAVGP